MKKKRNKKNQWINIIIVVILLVGLSLLLYPTFSELWNSTRQSMAITEYAEQVSEMDEETCEKLWKSAQEYNERLRKQGGYSFTEEEKKDYESQLDINGNGIMGYIDIPKIDCFLPIYHGTEESVLQVAVGHLEWSTLPVGGEGTHCVLSGHRGLPRAKLFTNLDKMEEGDCFILTVLNQKLAYEVDQIEVVLPEEVDDLSIIEGKDYVTLVTCTPYGINTHRLLIRGHRVPYTEVEKEETKDSVVVTKNLTRQFFMMVALVLGGLALLLLLMQGVFRKKRKKKLPETNGKDRKE